MRLFPFARCGDDGAGCAHGVVSPDGDACARDPTLSSSKRLVNLRVARMSPWRFVPNALGIFAGSYRSPEDAFDFIGDDFLVEFTRRDASLAPPEDDDDDWDEKPVQHSGDALGNRRAFRLSVAGHVRFVDFLGMPEHLAHLGRRTPSSTGGESTAPPPR